MRLLPISANYNHRFNTTIGSVIYQFSILYNSRLELPTMTISIAGEIIASGIILVSGVNIVGQLNLPLDDIRCQNIEDTIGEIDLMNINKSSFVYLKNL